MKKPIAIVLIVAAVLITRSGLTQDQSNLREQAPVHTVSISELKQEPAYVVQELNQRGLSFQGLFMNDWSKDLNGRQSDFGFGRYSLDLTVNIDGNKALGWKGTSVSARMKQHINEFGGTYDGAAQVPSNIDAKSRTVLYELWGQQTFFSEKLRIKAGRIDANTEFDQVQTAGDFLNSSMGYSPTIMAFPSYPEPKVAAGIFYTPMKNSQLGLGVFRIANGGILSIAEPGHGWVLTKRELPGRASMGYWRLDGNIERFDGMHSSVSQGLYGVVEQSVWRSTLQGTSNTRTVSTFFQFGHSNRWVSDLTEHLGIGAVMQAPFSARPHDAIGIAMTGVQFSSHRKVGERRISENIVEGYYKLVIPSRIALVQDFQVVRHASGLRSNGICPIVTPRMIFTF